MLKPKPRVKLWLEIEGGWVFGLGAFRLLHGIQEKGTLKGSAEELKMSYRHAWGIIKEIEKRVGQPIIITHRGGKFKGGAAELTPTGKELIKTYLGYKKALNRIFHDEDFVED